MTWAGEHTVWGQQGGLVDGSWEIRGLGQADHWLLHTLRKQGPPCMWLYCTWAHRGNVSPQLWITQASYFVLHCSTDIDGKIDGYDNPRSYNKNKWASWTWVAMVPGKRIGHSRGGSVSMPKIKPQQAELKGLSTMTWILLFTSSLTESRVSISGKWKGRGSEEGHWLCPLPLWSGHGWSLSHTFCNLLTLLLGLWERWGWFCHPRGLF